MAQRRRPARPQGRTGSDGRRYRKDKRSAGREARQASHSHPGRRRQRRRRRHRRRRAGRTVLFCLVFLAALCLLGTVLFQTESIEVGGNEHTPAQDVVGWLEKDPCSSNTLCLLWKYRRDGLGLPPSLSGLKVRLKSPHDVYVQVTEKTYVGRVECGGVWMYFDQDGVASLKTQEVIEGVPAVEGLGAAAGQAVLGEKIPAEDGTIFEEISEAAGLLDRYELTPDRILLEERDMTLVFGGIRVMIGSSSFNVRIAQIPPILAKMNELYAGQPGTLHLENYESSDTSVRFVPDTL